MSKRTNPHKKALKQHAAAMHNARYMLGKEFDALEAGRKHIVATTANGDMGVATEPTSVATGTLTEFMENCGPGDVYVERGIEVVKDQPADGQLQVEDVVEFLNDIGAYPVSSSSDGVQIDPSKPIEISFSGAHEPKDYQLPIIASMVEEPKTSGTRSKEILLRRGLMDGPRPVVDLTKGGQIGFAPPEQPKE